MASTPRSSSDDTSAHTAVLAIWTVVLALGCGIALSGSFNDGTTTAGGFFFGLILGAFSSLPFWALWGIGKHASRNAEALRSELAVIRRQLATHDPDREGAEKPSLTNEEVVAQLLADPEVGPAASKVRREYGLKRAAAYLTEEAQARGHFTVFSSRDLPKYF